MMVSGTPVAQSFPVALDLVRRDRVEATWTAMTSFESARA